MFWFAVSIITMAFILLKILLPNIIDFGVIGTVLVAAGVVLLIIQIINENKKEKKDERRT